VAPSGCDGAGDGSGSTSARTGSSDDAVAGRGRYLDELLSPAAGGVCAAPCQWRPAGGGRRRPGNNAAWLAGNTPRNWTPNTRGRGCIRWPATWPSRATIAAGRRERSRSGGAWRAVVAACLAAIAGAVTGFWLASAPAGPRPATVTITGTNPALHMSATAALTATSWGTSIELRL